MKTKKMKTILFAILLITVSSYSQDKFQKANKATHKKSKDFSKTGGKGDNAVNAADGTSAPFDFGISLLLAAGIGFAAKKRFDARMKERVIQA